MKLNELKVGEIFLQNADEKQNLIQFSQMNTKSNNYVKEQKPKVQSDQILVKSVNGTLFFEKLYTVIFNLPAILFLHYSSFIDRMIIFNNKS